MTDAQQILVIFLSSALAIFLLLAIVLMAKVIQIVNAVKRFTDTAEEIADKANAISDVFKNAAGPLAVTKLVAGIVETIKDQKNQKKRKD